MVAAEHVVVTRSASGPSRRWDEIVAVVAGWRTIRMFREDRLLLSLTILLGVACLVPMIATPFLPLVDLGSNIGAAGLMDDVLFHRPIAKYFKMNWYPVPYWSGYAIMAFFDALMGPFVAAKATVALAVLALPVAHMRLLTALGRSPRLGLWAFLLAWDVNMYWGWFTFQIGMALALVALAWMIETTRLRDVVKIIFLTAVIALSHLHATLLVGVAAIVMAFVKPKPLRALFHHALSMAGFAVLLPWIVARLFSRASAAGGHITTQDTPWEEKIASIYRLSLDTLPKPDAVTLTCLAFLLLIMAPAALGALDRRAQSPRNTAMAVAFLATCVGLYLFLPFAVGGAVEHWWTYPRYATYILLGMLLLPAPRLRGKTAWALAPGILLVLAIDVARFRQFAAFGERTRPYLDIIASMKPDSTFLPLDYEFAWPGTREWPLGQLHGYAAAATSSFDPHLFDNPNTPLVFRDEARLPSPDWRRCAESFTMDSLGRFYDYIVTHPKRLDVVDRLPPGNVQLLRESGEWRVYKVLKHDVAAALPTH
jgi:hypothetical protein